jgi:hypothetical protein
MNKLISRGYQVGGGMISPDGQFFYLSIPKNASTFISSVLHQNNWHYSNLSTFTGDKIICVLRDPIDRWVSGMATYCALYLLGENYGSDMFVADYNLLTEKLIFDNIVFDDHTEPQTTFVNFVPDNKQMVYFLANNNLVLDDLSKYLNHTLTYNHDTTNENASENNYDTRQISRFLRSQLDEELTYKLRVRYKQDYQLLKYATR